MAWSWWHQAFIWPIAKLYSILFGISSDINLPEDIMQLGNYMKQCLLHISGVLWHSQQNNFTAAASDPVISRYIEFENYTICIVTTSPRGHWVNKFATRLCTRHSRERFQLTRGLCRFYSFIQSHTIRRMWVPILVLKFEICLHLISVLSQRELTLSGCTDGSQKVLCTLELESNATVYWDRYIDLQLLIDIPFPGNCGQYWAPGMKDPLFK